MSETKFYSPSRLQPLVEKPEVNRKTPSKMWAVLGIIGAFIALILIAVGLVFYLYIFRPGQILLAQGRAVQADVTKIQDTLLKRDLVSLETNLIKTETDVNGLRTSRDENFSWARNFKYTQTYYQDSDHFINAGLYAIQALREAATVIMPFADAAGLKVSTDPNQPVVESSLLDAFSTWIAVMPKVADDLDGVIAQLDLVGKELAYIDARRYPETINGVEVRTNIERAQKVLTQLDTYAPDIKQALQIIPGLLGVGTGEKRYMVIMQNDKEIRATGGFWTNYATFKIRNGLLSSDFSSKDMYSIDTTLDRIDAVFTFPVPPAAYTKYLKVARWYARDANASPDLPTSIDQFLYSYNIASRISPLEIKPVDGIFTMDTQVIREMLDVTGPVTVNGLTYDTNNVVLELERIASLELREQTNRKRVLGDLMERMLINVFESDKNLWPKLVEKGIDLVARKHIQAYSFDPAAQALFEKYNLAGRIVDPVVGDYAYVVQTNLGGDKTNWFVNKVVTHTLAMQDNRWIRTVNVKYAYPQPSDDFLPFVKRFRDWVRVYVPLGSEFISVDGSEDGTGQDQERNKTYYTAYVELGPGETKELTFKYYLPNGLIKDDVWNLYIQKQSGIDKEVHNVVYAGKADTVNLAMDYQYSKKLK